MYNTIIIGAYEYEFHFVIPSICFINHFYGVKRWYLFKERERERHTHNRGVAAVPPPLSGVFVCFLADSWENCMSSAPCPASLVGKYFVDVALVCVVNLSFLIYYYSAHYHQHHHY